MNWEDREHFDKQFQAVFKLLTAIQKQGEKQMAALDDKTQAIVTLVVKIGTDLANLITDLKNNSGQPTTAQLQALDDIATKLQGVDTTITTADPGPASAA
jgi:hypothetical protein